MFILKGVKVLCFDTLLQVFILKVFMGALKLCKSGGGCRPLPARDQLLDGDTPPRVFWKKRLDLLDCKGFDFFGGAQEAASS